MAENVTVNLDRRRPYRAQASDRRAVWVGPGRVEVPAWVAEAWGLSPVSATPDTQRAAADSPESEWSLADYDNLSAAQIIPQVGSLTREERLRLADYERSKKNRSTVLDALERDEEG